MGATVEMDEMVGMDATGEMAGTGVAILATFFTLVARPTLQ